MPYIEVPEAFQIEIPDGWGSTSVDGNEYTLSSGDGRERIDIKVYRARTKQDATPDAATAAVREWAKGVGVVDAEKLSVVTAAGDVPRAFATIRGAQRDIFVGFFYFKKSFVIAAASAPSKDVAGFKRVEQLLWSFEAA